MFFFYLKSVFRNLRRQPVYSVISFSGLSLGLACAILITQYIQFELGFDKFHERLEDIYEIHAEVHWGPEPWIQNNLQAPLAPEMQKRFPEIQYTSRFNVLNNEILKIKNESFYEDGFALVDSQFFKIFTFPIISGSTEKFFKDPYSIILTEDKASKFFGNKDPVGKTIELNNHPLTVAGTVKNVPENSSMQFDFVLPFSFLKILWEDENLETHWGNWYMRSFLTLHENTDVAAFKKKIEPLYKEQNNVKPEHKVLIHPYKKMRLKPLRLIDSGLDRLDYLYITAIVAFMVLVIACINFMNLSTACYSSRSKEVGIKKTLGSRRIFLIHQFFIESFILTVFGGLISLLVVYFTLPFFNKLIRAELIMDLWNIKFIVLFFLLIGLTAFLAGLYPSFYLSSFQPVKTLKGRMISSKGKIGLRKGLVVFQFSLSILFITGTLITFKQLKYMLNKDIGYDKEHVIFSEITDASKYHLLKEELLKNPHVMNVSAANWWGFDNMSNTYGYDYPGKPRDFDLLLTYQEVDFDYIETIGIPIVEGRSFSKEYKTDSDNAFILNETAIKAFDIIDPVGARFNLHGRQGFIVGVMKDVHFRNLGNRIDPRIIHISNSNFGRVLIRLSHVGSEEPSLNQMISSISKSWETVYTDTPFDFTFLDDDYKSVYEYERTITSLFSVFAILAILISCLGLFGLALFTAEQKTKEIGIRKTNGAHSRQIISSLILEFLKYVVIAYAIIGPVTYFFMKRWLNNFAYQTELSWWIFVLAGIIASGIAMITVSWQSWQAASKNPVEILKYE